MSQSWWNQDWNPGKVVWLQSLHVLKHFSIWQICNHQKQPCSKQKALWNVAGILCVSAMPLSSLKICFSQKKQPTALLQPTFSITFRSDMLSYPSQPHTQNAKAGVNKSSRSYSHCHKQQKPWEPENILLNHSGLKEKITTATTIRIQQNYGMANWFTTRKLLYRMY